MTSRGVSVAAVLSAASVVGVQMASSSPAAAYRAPFDRVKADGYTFDYVSTEATADIRNHWDPYWDAAMEGEWDNKTDLSVTETGYYSGVDLYWYSLPDSDSFWNSHTPGAAAVEECITYGDFVCNRARVVIKDSAAFTLNDTLKKNLACHEAGHAIGFSDGTDRTSCLDSGDNGLIGFWEASKVNEFYYPY